MFSAVASLPKKMWPSNLFQQYGWKMSPGTHFTKNDLILISGWISNCVHYIVWFDINYPFPNFKDAAVGVWVWISNLISHFARRIVDYPCWKLGKETRVIVRHNMQTKIATPCSKTLHIEENWSCIKIGGIPNGNITAISIGRNVV